MLRSRHIFANRPLPISFFRSLRVVNSSPKYKRPWLLLPPLQSRTDMSECQADACHTGEVITFISNIFHPTPSITYANPSPGRNESALPRCYRWAEMTRQPPTPISTAVNHPAGLPSHQCVYCKSRPIFPPNPMQTIKCNWDSGSQSVPPQIPPAPNQGHFPAAAPTSIAKLKSNPQMKVGIVVFPGSNCDHDAWYAISTNLARQGRIHLARFRHAWATSMPSSCPADSPTAIICAAAPSPASRPSCAPCKQVRRRRRPGPRHLQRLSDSGRSRPAARRAAAQ